MVLVPAGHSDSKSLRFPNSFLSLNPHIYLIDARVLWTRSSNVLASLHSSPDLLPLTGFMTSSSLTWATAAGSWLASLSLTIRHPAINNYHFKSKPQYSTLPSKLRGLAYRHLPNLVPKNLFGVISYTSPEPLWATVNFFLFPKWVLCCFFCLDFFLYFLYRKTPTYPLETKSKLYFLPETSSTSPGPVTAPLHKHHEFTWVHHYLILNHSPLLFPPNILLGTPLRDILNPLP